MAEVKALSNITLKQVQDFFWEDIICRYRIPKVLRPPNGKQFDSKTFKGFCEDLGIDQHFASVAHSQTNDLAKVTNKIISQGLKRGWTMKSPIRSRSY